MGTVIQQIVNGTTVFKPDIEPTEYNIQKSDLYSDSTGRSAESGALLAYPIRRNIYTIKLEYYGNDTEIEAIENMIDNYRLKVTFMDNGEYVEKTMYPSDREKTTEIIHNGKGWHRLSFSLIQY